MTVIVNGTTGITYPDNTTQASAASGGYTIHTFTSSGTYTA